MPLIFSLRKMCVTHPASCLSELLALSGSGDLFMSPLKGPHSHASSCPYSSKNASGIYPEPCWVLFLVVKLQHVLGKGREKDPRYPSKQLWNQARSMSFAVSLSFFWRKLMNWEDRKEMLRA